MHPIGNATFNPHRDSLVLQVALSVRMCIIQTALSSPRYIYTICYKIKSSAMRGTSETRSHENIENVRGAFKGLAALHPGGVPRVTVANAEVDVVTTPWALVKTIVATVGAGVIAGRDVTFTSFWPPKSAL